MIKLLLSSFLLLTSLNGWCNDAYKVLDKETEKFSEDSIEFLNSEIQPNNISYHKRAKKQLRKIDSLKNMHPINWMELMITNYRLSGIYANIGEFTKSIDAALNGIRISETRNNNRGINIGYTYVSRGLREQGNYKEAFYYLRKKMQALDEIEDDSKRDRRILLFYQSLALIYQDEERHLDSALYYYELVLAIRKKERMKANPGNYKHIGYVLYKMGQYQKALKALRVADSLNESFKATSNPMAWMMRNATIQNYLGMAYFGAGNISLAIESYNKSSIQSRKIGMRKELMLNYKGLGECYERINKLDSSVLFKNLYIALKDSLYTEESKQHIAELTAVYETEKKNKTIQDQLLEIEYKKTQINRFIAIVVVLLFSIFVIIVFLRNRRLNAEKELQSKFSQDLIKKVEHERERIARDLHDSVGQNLLIIKNQNSLLKLRLKDKKLIEKSKTINTFASQTIDELREISNNLTPYQLGRIGLTKAVEDLIDRVSKSTDIKCIKDISNIDTIVDLDLQINLFRIVQESLNNIIKHSQATEISFVASTSKIEIFDNGVGFNTSKSFGGMGIGNLTERAKLLQAESNIESGPNLGTRITLEFKQSS